jgi:hypothetical protein
MIFRTVSQYPCIAVVNILQPDLVMGLILYLIMMDDLLFGDLLTPADFVALFFALERPCGNLEESIVEDVRVYMGSTGVPED